MGVKGTETRGKLVDAARTLVERHGYYGAGLNQILAASGAPRGSLYFHFPGGKDELVAAAIAQAGKEIAALIDTIEPGDAAAAASRLLRVFGDRLEASDWQQGCPVATVALDVAAANDAVQAECAAAYAAWQQALRLRLRADGRENADDLAATVLAMVEGALLLARAQRSREPLERVERTLHALL
ncbi:TetR/AcrR family transcriptional regulator [Streptomyces gardneri]|uniref:TetR/AcrR family transcriptional regulator n=1 Tax=Nocardia sputi TaxID=2943705 RepID=UPI001892E2EE|nr:TetR/AcrR family transcriptional regulator [Nocardia sputi]MBF6165559.1 TetR/AcrR family transcriptional regulator [Streptomyces gardneri]MBF6202882.1 TetR/AcrR family transcriptional regulator [Streptomyces gardneri]UAK29781.1 TetR/AcrR family transcriptional regulator [Nocardia asteroides]